MKVIYHIDERDKWGMVLANLKNMTDYYSAEAEEYEIEVVANGPAVADYVQSEDNQFQEQMKALMSPKVIFAACANALRGQGIPTDTLLESVMVVKAGVVELAKKQSEGYAYLKP